MDSQRRFGEEVSGTVFIEIFGIIGQRIMAVGVPCWTEMAGIITGCCSVSDITSSSSGSSGISDITERRSRPIKIIADITNKYKY